MKKEISTKIEHEGSWISWVGSVSMCLKALGVNCDLVEVAGYSGYGFALAVNEGLCASGPTFLDWNKLASGVCGLGRSTLSYVSMDCYAEGNINENTTSHARYAFELVKQEIEADRPCVVWGLGIPEFGVVKGIEDDYYLCVQGAGIPEKVKWDEINAPGGPYVLAFPTIRTNNGDWNLEKESIRNGVIMMTRLDYADNMRCGLNAYDYWCSQLEKNNAVTWSNSYNAQCWSEARNWSAEFVERISKQYPKVEPLKQASDHLKFVAEQMNQISKIFPFTMKFEQEMITDQEVITKAISCLKVAKKNEEKSILYLKSALVDTDFKKL